MQKKDTVIILFLIVSLSAQSAPLGAQVPEPAREITLPAGEGENAGEEASILFIGNATVILRIGPFTILTDPNFVHKGDHVHLGYGMKAKRLTDPALEIEELPHIDFLLVSHFHGDHFDQAAEREIPKDKPIVTAADAVDEFRDKGFTNVHGLEKWEPVILKKGAESLTLTAMPARHAPLFMQPMLPDVIGSMIEYQTPDAEKKVRIYISGDTLMHGELGEISARFPGVDAGLFHLGGTRLFGVLLTMDARQGVAAMEAIKPRTAIPVHYNDYDVFKSSLEDFKKEVSKSGYGGEIVYLEPGQAHRFKIPDVPSAAS